MQKIRDNKGITLLEVLISMAIISIIGMSFFFTLNNTTKSNAKNEKNLKTMDIAQSEMELITKEIKSGNNEINLNNKETIILNKSGEVRVSYNKVDGNKNIYLINLYINIENKSQQNIKYFLYNIEISVQSESDLSDREVTLKTHVLERF